MNCENKFAIVRIPKLILSILLIGGGFSISAQDFEHFHPTLCSGRVPDDFKQFASEKHTKDLNEIKLDLTKNRKRKQQEKEFSLNSNFKINDLLFSGRILFGDPMTTYVNDVAKNILKDKPELLNKLRFYIIKSDVVNAFATQQGIIFINTGLLAQINNEAELAFVLSHEIGHYVKNHGLEGYIEKQKIKRGSGNYRNMSLDKRVEEYYRYSKDNEQDADIWGYELYRNSEYGLNALEGVFDVLLYSYLPFDELEFKFDWYEKGNLKLPGKYKLDSTNTKSISAKEEKDDSYSTHPNIRKRKENILSRVETEKSTSNKLFLLGKERFELIRKTARYEVCLLYLSSGKYSKALYSGWLLTQLYPERLFPGKIMLMALYGLYTTTETDESLLDQNSGSEEDKDGSWKGVEGSSQPVYFMLSKMPNKEIATMIASFAWRLREQYPEDPFVKRLSKDIIYKLVKKEEVSIKDFELEKVNNNQEKTQKEEPQTDQPETKTDKIKKKKKKSEDVSKEKNYWRLSFASLNENSIKELKKAFMAVDNENTNNTSTSKSSSDDDKEAKRREEYGVALGIEKIILFSPVYEHLFKSGTIISEDLLASENGSLKTQEYIKSTSELCGLNINMLDIKGSDEEILKSININSQLYSFLLEKLRYEDSSLLFYSQYVDDIIRETGAEHMGLFYIRTFPTMKNSNYTSTLCVSSIGAALCSPLFLGYLCYARTIGGRGVSEYTFALIDIKDNQIEFFDYKSFNGKINQEQLRQMIYQTLAGVKRKAQN